MSDQTEQFGARAGAQQPNYPPPPMRSGSAGERPGAAPEPPLAAKKKRRLRDPLSILLVLIIVVALLVAGLIGAELYVRNEATNKIAEAAACVTKDQATAKFGTSPLVLWQLITKHFTNISVETAGNQLKDAKGMKLNLRIEDVRINETADSKGTIGLIDATLTWTAKGIQESIKDKIGGTLSKFVSNTVVTHPNDGTIELKGKADNIVAKPVVSDGGIKLDIQSFNVVFLGDMPKDSAQKKLDKYTSDATKNLPLGIHADKVDVTSDSVVAHFISQNATIPNNKAQDPCFANL